MAQGGVYENYWASGGPANATPSSTKDTDTGVRGTEPCGVDGEGPQRTSIRGRGHVPPPRARGDLPPHLLVPLAERRVRGSRRREGFALLMTIVFGQRTEYDLSRHRACVYKTIRLKKKKKKVGKLCELSRGHVVSSRGSEAAGTFPVRFRIHTHRELP